MKKLSENWGPFFVSKPETGMGFHTGNVTLHDGRSYEDVVFNSGYITEVRNYEHIPFESEDIASIQITGRRWAWVK